jgi:NAD(P)H-dependent flavin oxidoreductase YrpB (nitropropane dioxygenase family)
MITTAFTRLAGCTAPIQLAPMPGITTTDLAVAVADAGGVALLPTPLLAPEVLAARLGEIASRTRGAFGAGFLVPFLDPACLRVAAERSRVVDFFYGDPNATLVAMAKARGALAGWQVGSRDEAVAAEQAGCDYVVAQGTEAGGHVRGTTSLLPLLDQVLAAVRVPVLAAGGIATARQLAAVLAAGAAGARLGTRFVAASESGAHPRYVEALLAADAADTCLTEAFGADWPHAPHRVLRSSIDAMKGARDEVVGETRFPGVPVPVPRGSAICPSRDTTGRVEAMALYAGESVACIDDVRPAAEIVAELVSGAERLLAARRG